MVQPAYIANTRAQSVDALVDPATGTMRTKIAVGNVDLSGLAVDGAWEGVATHAEGAEFFSDDGVAVIAGVDSTGTPTARAIAVDAAGNLIVATQASVGSLTDFSDDITAGGVSQTLAVANVLRKYIFVQNLDASEDLWINFGAAATIARPSIKISAGGSFVMEGSFVSTQEITVIATTIGHDFTAKEG